MEQYEKDHKRPPLSQIFSRLLLLEHRVSVSHELISTLNDVMPAFTARVHALRELMDEVQKIGAGKNLTIHVGLTYIILPWILAYKSTGLRKQWSHKV